jgi:hypothetical protein
VKVYWGGGVAAEFHAFLILELYGGEWSASRQGRFTPQGKNPSHPLDRRLGGPQSRSGCGGEEKYSQSLPGLEPPIIQTAAQRYTNELYRFQCHIQSN